MKSEICVVHSVAVGLHCKDYGVCINVTLCRSNGDFVTFGNRLMFVEYDYDCVGYWIDRLFNVFGVTDLAQCVGKPAIVWFVGDAGTTSVAGLVHPLNLKRFFPEEDIIAFKAAASRVGLGKKLPVLYTKETIEQFLIKLESQKHDAAMRYKISFDPKTINDECVRYSTIQETICDAETHFGLKSKATTGRGRLEAEADKVSRSNSSA